MSKVSVIIPVFNVESYLQKCLYSLINQTYKDLEIICIDDGSKDGSGKILDDCAAKDNRFVVKHQQNAGVSSARNCAMNIATSEYVMFVDADDWLEPEAIEKTLEYTQDNNLDICSFSYISEHGKAHLKHALFDENKIMDEVATRKMARRIIGPIGEELRYPLMLDSYGTIWAKLYKKSVVKGLKFEDLNKIGTAEDSLFNMFAYRKAHRTGYLHDFFYHYRRNNNEASTRNYKFDLPNLWKVEFDLIMNSFLDSDSQRALQNRIAINIYGHSGDMMKVEHSRKLIKEFLNDPVFAEARQQLDTKHMTPLWRFFFNAVKKGNITEIMLFHKIIHIAKLILR